MTATRAEASLTTSVHDSSSSARTARDSRGSTATDHEVAISASATPVPSAPTAGARRKSTLPRALETLATLLGSDQRKGPLLTAIAAGVLVVMERTPLYVPNPGSVLVAVVAYAGFLGGVRSGLVSASIALIYSAYFFTVTGPSIAGDNGRRFIVVLLATPAVALATGRLKDRLSRSRVAQQRAEDEAEATRSQLASIVESSEEAIVSKSLDGTIRTWNRSATRLFGYAPEEVIGRPVTILIPPDHHHEEPVILARVSRGERIAHYETVRLRKDGTLVDVSLSVSPIRDASGRIVGAAKIIRDISERKRAEQQLAERAERLAQSNEELEQFAYVASHDLQEPLRMVSSYTQLLARRYKDKLDDNAREFIQYAVDGATRMQVLINDLLAYSRLDTRGWNVVPTSSQAALERALANLRLAIEESGAAVTHGPLPTVIADAVQLTQLFQNLVGNALKFRGAEPARVHVSAERSDDEWVFAVRDNGIGIDPSYGERIFVIFQRLHGRTEYPGTGIGLAICKKIVERHGGRIWLEVASGPGATFRFTLPARKQGIDL
jgi:PAS domain S-box-containing protein